jgi:hypothetical protein
LVARGLDLLFFFSNPLWLGEEVPKELGQKETKGSWRLFHISTGFVRRGKVLPVRRCLRRECFGRLLGFSG